ncbi:endo-1,4-beta-xylanase xylA, putative (macronuclear) [Tetrahymena thermophila SB210]|uniref:Endo-1,4-beta-xylanase xylA, putative n=1 Tax=Tetrahymena thermophila (strain SB210) TaxID=312017 RepID=Q23B11_TETTS|nr:endo-1,4-beta-xylanase xylA, putative [Tetrahymena thermophila SB210]EAR93673.2 endo-1,4-beta-xylanase xylA, putative [Tetrahymena thermophila SB210]|eukprot:XP_001013918.2 endo-1,4-beta-xylanase xylA, putative [Tetrahymena thermophila SB210]
MSNNHVSEQNQVVQNAPYTDNSHQNQGISQNQLDTNIQSQKQNMPNNLEKKTHEPYKSRIEAHDSVESSELINQLAQLSSQRKKQDPSGDSKLLEEPNDIDDDLNFSQNTFETKDIPFNIDTQMTETNPKVQSAARNNQILQDNLEDSLEKGNNNLGFKNNLANKQNADQVQKKQDDEKHKQIMIIENNQFDKKNDKLDEHMQETHINQVQNTIPQNPQQLLQDQAANQINLQEVAKQLQAGEQIKYFPQQTDKEIKPVTNQQKDLQQKGIDQKLVTFQAENVVEDSQNEGEFQENLVQYNQQNIPTTQQNLQTVQEESNIYQSSKGSIIPPQTFIQLNVNEQQENHTQKKPFDYQQLEGFLKNQKRNMVFPKQNENQEIIEKYNENILYPNQENQFGDSSPLINKGNASKNSGLNISSENFKFTVQPIVNSSQFFHQEPRSNNSPQQIQLDNGKTNLKAQGNRIMSNSGIKQVGFVDDQQQKINSQSLQVSEMYQSNFYQDVAPSGKHLSDQTLISITNSSQPSNLVNRLSNFKSNQEDFQNDFQQQQQPQQKQQMKRFTNLRESMNEDQDIPEELSILSKNTVQKYMAEQVNIIGSGTSIKDAKRQSTASMLTVESKDMEAATQDQVRKIVAEQVENMIKSKLDGQSSTKQNNLIFNNEDLFRQVIREELQNFLKQNANLIRPGSINQLSSPSNSYQNSRIQDRKNANKQFEKVSEKKFSSAQISQREIEQMSLKEQLQIANQNPSPYLNNQDIDNIIDESIQKHQFAQLQNKFSQFQNQQQNFDRKPVSQNTPETAQKLTNNRDFNTREFEETKRKTDYNKYGDFPISITGNNQKNNQNQQISNKSYKDQYLLFKNGIQNEQSNNNDSLQNYTQNHQMFAEQKQSNRQIHQNSHITTENSPQFAVERDSLRLAEISFSMNRQQANQINRPSLISNESHSSNQNFNHNHLQNKQSHYQQYQQSRNLLSKQSDYSISSFAPLPPIRHSKSQQDSNMNQQDSQRDTLPDAPFSSAQSPTSLLVQSGQEGLEQKLNYQNLIINPPKRHLRAQSDNENEYQNANIQNNNYMMESSIIQRNSDQHQSIESIQNQVFYNQNQGIFNSQKKIRQPTKGNQGYQNQQSITQIWEKSLDFQSRGQLNRAYQMLLDIEDDIYLLRMMSITGPCFSKLNQNVGKKLIRRINKITQSQFMDSISFQLFQKIYEQDLLEDLNLEDHQSIKEILYDISATPFLGEQAAKLYNLIDNQENS